MIHLKKIAVLFCVVLMMSATGAVCQDENEDLPEFGDFIPTEKIPEVSNVMNLMKLVKYPELAKTAGVEGIVTVGVLIGKDGKPIKTKIISSANSNLNSAAVEAIMAYRGYTPAENEGKPVACWLIVPINFKLSVDEPDNHLPTFDELIQVDKEPSVSNINDLMRLVKYPFTARQNNIEGLVTIAVLIDKDGKPIKTNIISSDNGNLNESAIDAVMQYDGYIPAEINGELVECWMTIPINFQLRN